MNSEWLALMARVKICGITSENDVEILNRYLPDYAGFVFAKSRRQLTSEAAGRLSEKLSANIGRVGVFVNAELDDILEAVDAARLDAVQLHGDETSKGIEQLRQRLNSGIEIWKAIRVKDPGSISELSAFAADRYLLDAYVEGTYGGAGRSFDWEIAGKAAANTCIILAGGLNPTNAGAAVRAVRPFAVDVSSGVETGGIKDKKKIRDFLNAVEEVEALE